MATPIPTLLSLPKLLSPPPPPPQRPKQTLFSSLATPSDFHTAATPQTHNPRPPISGILCSRKAIATVLGAGLSLITLVGPASGAELPLLGSILQLNEPSNALSLPTWTIHISSVVEWVTAMALVWQYGEVSGYDAWKGLSWGMVPLFGGALCACTWHFFYNSESLEVLVALQAALTVIGNATMCIAAFRIYKSSQEQSKKL